MECKERLRLLGEYDAAIVAAALAQASLSDAGQSGYRAIRLAQNMAEVRLAHARKAYESHIIEHGCTSERTKQ
jgi:hypothetical protein